MTYGLSIVNSDSRVQIDSSYSNMYLYSYTPAYAASNSNYPPPNFSSGDLLMARPYVSSGTRSVNLSRVSGSPKMPECYYHTMKRVAGNLTNPNSGMGLAVYNSAGQVQFYSGSNNKMLEIASIGTISGNFSGPYTKAALPNTVYYPSSTGTISNLSKYYCLIQNTDYNISFSPDGLLRYDGLLGYEYEWVSGDSGRIKIYSYFAILAGDGSGGDYYTAGSNAYYIIMRETP